MMIRMQQTFGATGGQQPTAHQMEILESCADAGRNIGIIATQALSRTLNGVTQEAQAEGDMEAIAIIASGSASTTAFLQMLLPTIDRIVSVQAASTIDPRGTPGQSLSDREGVIVADMSAFLEALVNMACNIQISEASQHILVEQTGLRPHELDAVLSRIGKKVAERFNVKLAKFSVKVGV